MTQWECPLFINEMGSDEIPLISIITPTYNHERFVAACIESALSQTYCHWEQIVIDDGSTDGTPEIASSYLDPRIRVVRQPNQGPFELANTYNYALRLAKGELIAILEGDDFWPSDKLSTLVPVFSDPRVVLAYGESDDVDASGQSQRIATYTTRLRKKLPASVLLNLPVGTATQHMLLTEGRSLVSPSTVLLRHRTLNQIGGFQYVPGLPLTDYPTFLELSLVGSFYYSPQIMGYRRRHEHSITINHARTIFDQVSDFTLRFLSAHHEQILFSESEFHALLENWRRSQDKLDFAEGRTLLLRKRWREAGARFQAASSSKRLSVRLAAIAGLLFSWLHMDIESLMVLGGRSSLR